MSVHRGFAAFYQDSVSSEPILMVSALVAVIVLVTGAFYFRRMERTFADTV